jgi:hypothetical protein
MSLKIKLLLLLVFIAVAPMSAQTPVQKDTVKEKRDQMYQNLENYSKRGKFTKFVHKLIFRSVKKQELSQRRRKTRDKTPEMKVDYGAFEGKIVRKINVETLDPFGYSINDTTQKPDAWLEKFGNGIHLKTKSLTIKNLLLIKRNKPLDSLLALESERLIRSQRYVRRVVIRPVAIPGSKDSVDVDIRVLDSWSLIPNGTASTSRTSMELTERNFFGLGHEFRNEFDKRFNSGQTGYLARYTIPNIMNTYINTTVNYQIWKSDNSLKSVGVQRNFFSAYTKWAGGAYFESRLELDSLPDAQKVWAIQNYRSDSQDYWAGYAFKIYKGDTEDARTTRIVTTGRFFNRDYKEHPSIEYDSIGYYADEKLYLASIGLTSRQFVQDKFLFNYDIVEDIPIGKVYSLTAGMQDKNNERRLYLGGRYAFGNYYDWGFLSANIELGSFFYGKRTDQTTLRIEGLYFTDIKDWGRWRFRHFVKPALIFGDNRFPIITDQLNLNGDNGISGFDSRTLMGTKKALLTLQTQGYSPWNLFGFRLNPFANLTMGVIADEDTNLYQSKVYTKIGLGLLIYNDYLVFNSFQLSFAFFPDIPDNGSNIFKSNTFKNTDITLPNFEVGKPVLVPYQ